MDIVPGILSEAEVISMPVETLYAFSRLFNTRMHMSVQDYMNAPDSNPEAVQKLEACLGEEADARVFHLKVRDKNIKTLLVQNNLRDLPELAYMNNLDLDEFIEQLQWLCDNESKLKATLPARTTDMYKEAMSLLKTYQSDQSIQHDHDLPGLLKAYKESLFCPRREKPRQTGMRSLAMNKARWKMQLRAAEYLRYCVKSGITADIAREC